MADPRRQKQYLQQHQEEEQQMQTQTFRAEQYREIEQTTDFRSHSLPLADIKKIMKANKDDLMIATEALVMSAKACEMFIFQLTNMSWTNAEENKKQKLHREDVVAAITRTEVFGFLTDVIRGDIAGDEIQMSRSIEDSVAGGSSAESE